MERYLNHRVHPVPHRRIEEAIAQLPAPTGFSHDRDDLVEVLHAAVVVGAGVGLAVAAAMLAGLVEAILAVHLR
jgi:hypothetical protein